MTLIDKAEALVLIATQMKDARRTYEGFGHAQEALRFAEQMLAAGIAAIPARGVGVKPLVWTAREDGLQFYAKQHASGSIYFYYTVLFSEHTGEWSVLLDGLWRDGFPDAETAKAAAQADYEARILAAPSPAPDATEKGGDASDKDDDPANARPATSPGVTAGAEVVAWQSTTEAFIPFVTDERYRKFSPAVQKHYVPYRCPSCAPAPDAREAAWKAIATVPMDGTRVDLWSLEGFRACNCNPAAYDLTKFSHWMPVPKPPALIGEART